MKLALPKTMRSALLCAMASVALLSAQAKADTYTVNSFSGTEPVNFDTLNSEHLEQTDYEKELDLIVINCSGARIWYGDSYWYNFEGGLTINSGKSAIVVAGSENDIYQVVQNHGTITFEQGARIEASALSASGSDSWGYTDKKGNFSTSGNGFSTQRFADIQIVNGGTIHANGATVEYYGDDAYVLQDTGYAHREDEISYNLYNLVSGDDSTSSIQEAGGVHSYRRISMSSGGVLTLDTADMVQIQDFSDKNATFRTEGTNVRVDSINAKNATLEVNGDLYLGSTSKLQKLTLNSGADIGLGSKYSWGGRSIDVTTVEINDNATIDADLLVKAGTLTFAADKSITMSDALTGGSSVTIGSEGMVTVILDAEMIQSIIDGGSFDLISNAKAITLGTNIILTDINGTDYSAAPINLEVVETSTTSGKKYSLKVYGAPEPATATLSLLALAGLCARRRRH